MATLTGGTQFGINVSAALFAGLPDYENISPTPTELRLSDDSGNFMSLRGVGFTYNFQTRAVTGGQLRTIEVDDASLRLEFLLTGLQLPAKQLFDLVIARKFADAIDLILGGDDNFTGTAFRDTLNGLDGDDTVNSGGGNDAVFGGVGDDFLIGGGGKDVLSGGVDDDRLAGGKGNDNLFGNGGIDSLTGGAGIDSYIFNSQLGATNADKLFGFTPNVDRILVDNLVFTALTVLGELDADAFRTIGVDVADAQDRIIYVRGNGKLFYDSDGTGADTPELFATVGRNLPLAADDFFVI